MTPLRPHALIFPGQGSQHPGMLDRTPQTASLARLLDAAEALSGMSLRSALGDGRPERLADTRVAQPLLYLVDWAWGRTLLDSGLQPAVVAGHSLGEFAALAVAGVISVEAGLELVTTRARLMAEAAGAAHGSMAAVLGSDGPTIAALIEGISGVWIANDNAPGQVVLSGTFDGLEAATAGLHEAGVRKIVPLKVAGPFHSPLMTGAAKAFGTLLAGATFADAAIPVIQNTDPTPTSDAAMIRQRLLGQITSPVRWTETMRALLAAGVEVAIECGPGSVLAGLARRVDGLTVLSAEDAGLDRVMEVLAA
jgi:[acyl-carrier-protein] S-malonyltransferase